MIINGAGTTERKGDWTVQSVMAEYLAVGKLSRRKRAFMKINYLPMVRKEFIDFNEKLYNYLGEN
tara:strand:- start:5 stop:199 length:195 start_codon:yes stop_codon:yes gene_type:complete